MNNSKQYYSLCVILIRTLSLAILSAGLVGCGWTAKKDPSVLIVAIENLNFEDFPCDQGYSDNGFEDFCLNAIRFTHAYTPSVMSQSAIATLLTGTYPIDHGVRHNGNQYLSEKVQSVAESFILNEYKTSFFTGGPPVFRKSGFSKGFEFFDDQINLGPDKLYRSAEQTTNLFLEWIKRDVSKEKFFSFLYFPDLQFADVATIDAYGVMRSRGFDSQLRALDEALQNLILGLKSHSQYDNTIIILVGLNGRYLKTRTQEMQNTSLFSENTQVAMFIKPNHASRDLGINWKIDNNVSLADVGHTLHEIAGRNFEIKNDLFPTVSLKAIFTNPYASWSRERSILIETSWPQWRGLADVRYAIRKGQFLVVLDKEQNVYNSLIDRNESTELKANDKLRLSLLSQLAPELNSLGNPKWQGIDPAKLSKLKISQNLFRKDKNYDEFETELDALLLNNPNDKELNSWKNSLAVEKRDWQSVKNYAIKAKDNLLLYVAQYHLSEVFKGDLTGCGLFFRSKPVELTSRHSCRDETFLNLLRWQKSSKSEKLDYQEKFLKAYIADLLAERLTKLNHFTNLTWMVESDLSALTKATDLYLTLPQARRENAITRERIKRFFPEIN